LLLALLAAFEITRTYSQAFSFLLSNGREPAAGRPCGLAAGYCSTLRCRNGPRFCQTSEGVVQADEIGPNRRGLASSLTACTDAPAVPVPQPPYRPQVVRRRRRS
jgi:hypothetical protein